MCLAGQRDIAAKIGTVPPDSVRLTGMDSLKPDAEERTPSLNTVCACAYRWVHAAVRVWFLRVYRSTTMCLRCLAGAKQTVRMYEIHALVHLLVEYPAL